ncbi:hypothetical protein EON81_01800 [bacterium]|nr:MAG: hypothetical protein EON81_01800 [bacterium]
MATTPAKSSTKEASISHQIQARIQAGGERFWNYSDFDGMPPSAVAKTLSRLATKGEIQRAGKGLYYRSRPTVVGKSKPSQTKVAEASAKHKLHPSGLSAANALGFTTQNAAAGQYATTGTNRPTKLSGSKVYTRRSVAREDLDAEEGALLEFLRARGSLSELTPEETVKRLLQKLKEPKRFERLAAAALSEPPRVRAILGAVGEQTRQRKSVLDSLRASLNRLSRFDFGSLQSLKHAKDWQAK